MSIVDWLSMEFHVPIIAPRTRNVADGKVEVDLNKESGGRGNDAMTLEELTELARQCLEIVKGKDEMLEGCMMDALVAGEPESAINDALDIAYGHPELYARFPNEVYELAKDPEYTLIHPYLDLLDRHRHRSSKAAYPLALPVKARTS